MALAPAVLGPAPTEGRVLYTNVITCLVLGVNTTGTEHLSELHLETIYKTPKVMKAVVFFFFLHALRKEALVQLQIKPSIETKRC